MGRKKKKELKPWCWYCNREFEEEKVLIYHQKAKHFKCHICGKKLYTGPGLSIHCSQVHRHTVKAIPNALPHRTDPDVEIYGTEGIPFLDVMARAKQKDVDYVLKEKNITNAALPAKFERTLETPYGVSVERAVKPSTSPALISSNNQPILKYFNTPSSSGDPTSSCTPGDGSRQYMNGYNIPGEVPSKVSADRIALPLERCRMYHPREDISLEEHRLRFSKYSKFDPNAVQPPQPVQVPTAGVQYPQYQYPYYPQVPQVPQYPYQYPSYQIPQPPQVPPQVNQPPMAYPNMYQPPIYPIQSNYSADPQIYPPQPPGYYQ